MTTLKDKLQTYVDSWVQLGAPALLERFVLRNGREYIAAPFHGERMPAKECFRNALLYRPTNLELLYVEGFALAPRLPMPIHHAWTVDPKTSKVIDPTWKEPEACQYLGVPFNRREAWKIAEENGYYGLFAPSEMLNLTLLFARDPELKTLLKGVKP